VDVKLNPAFEMDPPIAEDVWVQRVKNDEHYLLVIAQFNKEQLQEKFVALNLDTAKLVMRDDGEQGDEHAGDGLYTVKVNTTIKEFEQQLADYTKGSNPGKRLVFKGHSIVADSMMPVFDRVKFDAGERASIGGIFPPRVHAALKDHSLMITDLRVVEDPTRTWNFCTQAGNIDGPWTFKTLMKNLAATSPTDVVTDVELSDFVSSFFGQWLSSPIVNGETVNARSAIVRDLQSWRARSQLLPPPRVPVGAIDMRAIPVKLLAIVNRLDLRGNAGYGSSNAGEARLVFCMMTPDGCTPSNFTIIFEYGVPLSGCGAVKAYATEWSNLSNYPFTDPQFNIRLNAITDQFTLCGTSPLRPNQSSLNQLRTDEFVFGDPPWELREFNIDNTTHRLKSVTVKQTPAVKYNEKVNNADVQNLAAYINTNQARILANRYTVPLTFNGTAFLGGHAFTGRTPFPILSPVGTPSGIEPFHWNGTATAGPAFINNDDARQIFSLGTCSGCHGGETQTGFTMIDPVPYGTAATMSGFLTGTPGRAVAGITPVDLDGNNNIMTVPDPAGRASNINLRMFNDLQRRADDLNMLVRSPCMSILDLRDILMFKPLGFVH